MTSSATSCVKDFVWLSAYYGGELINNLPSTLQDYYGILGLMPNAKYGTTKPLLMNFMYEKQIIDRQIFAFGLRGYGDPTGSFMDIGFYDTA